MLIEDRSKYYLKKVRAKSKMYEYNVQNNLHITVEEQANDLILLCIAIIGDVAEEIWNNEHEPISLSDTLKDELYFASRFFDSYYQSNLSNDFNDYYILMGAVAYYFCNMNGSSKVLIGMISEEFNFNASGLEKFIRFLLDDKYKFYIAYIDEKYRTYIAKLINFHNQFFDCTKIEQIDFKELNELKEFTYKSGSNREILFIDIILAIMKKKIINSCLNLMPIYSDIPKEKWKDTFINNTKMKEMWESQIILGENGIFRGKSGVVQMPTSSGKTASVALAIQSGFLANRINLAVIIAPFRALCGEIMFDLEKFFKFDKSVSIMEFNDIPESGEINDFSLGDSNRMVYIMTPEKFSYILKHNREIVDYINMIVFDEAHLFDDQKRGTDYELLLASIKTYLKNDVQKILISAVISNAGQINLWLNDDGTVIKNNTIKTTEKTVAFNTFFTNSKNNASYSNLYFVNPIKDLEEEFFVPRVIKVQKLEKLKNERKTRYFPDLKKNKQDVGIYYAIKLVRNGSVGIYCTRKDTVNNILSRFIELEKRGISLDNFVDKSDRDECRKIANLIKEHIGENDLYFSALRGIVGHHSGIPNGVRISAEYALRKSLVSCVVCTSTLAQGVNLPLKYLVVSSIYQGKYRIKVRDFHNLIGRTARAGEQTEGTIILTENIYKNNNSNNNQSKLQNYKYVLNPGNSEDCSSNLLKLVRDIKIGNIPLTYDSLKNFINLRYSDSEAYFKSKSDLMDLKNESYEKEELLYKIDEIENILNSLENFILNFNDVEDDSLEIIKFSYGYFIANDEEKARLLDIYKLIKSNIDNIDVENKKIFSKCTLGIIKMKELSRFVDKNIFDINNLKIDFLKNFLITQLFASNDCRIISKLNDKMVALELLNLWISGKTYLEIFNFAVSKGLTKKWGKTYIKVTLDDIILLCNSDFGYSSLSILQALIEILETRDCDEEIIIELNKLISSIRYGLPDQIAIYVYEFGISDRIISQKISEIIKQKDCSSKFKTKLAIRELKDPIKNLLMLYPSYFQERLRWI